MKYDYCYEILESNDPDKLANLVVNRLAHGWKLQGGVSSCYEPDTGYTHYSQAMYFQEVAL